MISLLDKQRNDMTIASYPHLLITPVCKWFQILVGICCQRHKKKLKRRMSAGGRRRQCVTVLRELLSFFIQ